MEKIDELHNDVHRQSGTVPQTTQDAYDTVLKWLEGEKYVKELSPAVKIGSVAGFTNNAVVIGFEKSGKKYKVEVVPRGKFFYLKEAYKGEKRMQWKNLSTTKYQDLNELGDSIVLALHDEMLIKIDPSDERRGRYVGKQLNIIESKFHGYDQFLKISESIAFDPSLEDEYSQD